MRIQRDIGTGETSAAIRAQLFRCLTRPRTIHGMVYNAMKLFMEINPQLFDDCSHEYNQIQEGAAQRQIDRENTWKIIEEQAKRGKLSNTKGTSSRTASQPKIPKLGSPMRVDEVDPITQDSQKRLDALKIQDEANARDYRDGRERRPKDHDRQNSVGSSRSQ